MRKKLWLVASVVVVVAAVAVWLGAAWLWRSFLAMHGQHYAAQSRVFTLRTAPPHGLISVGVLEYRPGHGGSSTGGLGGRPGLS